MVSVSEAEAVAEKMGSLYHETSAQTGEHVENAFDSAVKLGHTNREKTGRGQESKRRLRYIGSAWLPPISEYISCTGVHVGTFFATTKYCWGRCQFITENFVVKHFCGDVQLLEVKNVSSVCMWLGPLLSASLWQLKNVVFEYGCPGP